MSYKPNLIQISWTYKINQSLLCVCVCSTPENALGILFIYLMKGPFKFTSQVQIKLLLHLYIVLKYYYLY